MSIFNKSGFSFRLYDRESYVVTRDGRTAAELMEGERAAVSGALPKSKLTPKAAFQGTGAYQPRNPKFANFASPSASGSFGGGKSLYTSPSFYSPIHTATNWQIPTKRREVYLWNRFFAQNDPTVASSLRFYSQFPFSGFDNVMNDPIRKEHFDKVKKRLDLERWMPLIAYEYFGMGDAFPFISIDCPECAGFGKKPDGTVCKHHNEDAAIASVTVLNPDWVEVKINPLNPADPIISLIPDDTLKTIVFSKEPPEVYERIPVFIRQMIMQNKPIPLNKDSVTHLKHDEIPYLPYGRSLICPLFPMLAYQDKLRQAQWIVADRHILPIKICKIGNDQRPAGPQDISDTQAQLGATANDPNLTLVTHHAFQFEWVGSSGKVLQLTKEYELIDKAMIKGLGVNEALLSGTGPSYSQAAIGIEATIKRLKTVQKIMANWIIDKIYKVEARMRGFYKEDLQGNKILDYPDIRWDDLNLRDESQKNGLYMQLLDKKIVSAQFLCEKLDIDYDVETERVRLESEFQQQLGIAPEGGGKPGGGKPPGLGGGFGGGGGGAMPPPAGGGAKPGMPGAGGGMKGNLPGGQSAPGLPGDSLAPSMSGGEAGDYELKLKSHEQAKETAPQVHRPRKYKLIKPKEPKIQEPEQEVNGIEIDMDQVHQFRLTSIEAKLYQAIRNGQSAENLPADILFQQKPEPEQMSRVTVDAFSPSLKIIFEADGKLYHSSPEQIARDQERDSRFQQLGWIVVRFTEDQINYQIEKVLSTMIQAVNELTERNQQHFSENNNGLEKIANLEGIEEYNFEEDMIEENEEGFEQGDY